ncbi:MAG: WD40 repeat domain-containing protein, partial [bacterium]
FILRNALRAEVARRKADAVNVFVAADYESSYRLKVLISADGERALTAESYSLLLWDVRNRLQIAPLKRIKCCLEGVALSSDGTLVAYSLRNAFPLRHGIGVTNIATRTIMLQSELPKANKPVEARLIRFLPSNRGLLIGDTIGRLIFQDIDGNPARIVGEHLPDLKDASIYGRMEGLDISPDGRYAVTVTSYDGQVKIWDIAAGRLVRSVNVYKPTTGLNDKGGLDHDNPILVAFDSAGRTVTVVQKPGTFSNGPGVNRINRIDIANGTVKSVDPGGSIITAAASPKRDVIAISVSRSKEQIGATGNRPVGGGPWPKPTADEGALPQDSIDVYDLENLRLLGRVATVNKIWAITDFGRTALVGQAKNRSDDGMMAAADLVAGTFAPFARTNQRTIP